MDFLGVHWRYLAMQCLVAGLAFLWPVLSIVTLFSLRSRKLSDTAQAVWALLIASLPLLGAAAYWITNPGKGYVESSHHE